jgi:hypothetical protein
MCGVETPVYLASVSTETDRKISDSDHQAAISSSVGNVTCYCLLLKKQQQKAANLF